MNMKSFVVGQEFPAWFNEQRSKGKAKVNRDEDDEIVSITIHTPAKDYVAKIGDSIIMTKSGMVAVPKEAASKYGIGKKSIEKKEEK